MPQTNPSYDELANALIKLVEHNVSNLTRCAGTQFINCFTYPFGKFPAVYKRAMKLRERLIQRVPKEGGIE